MYHVRIWCLWRPEEGIVSLELDLLRFRASLLVWEASTGTQKEQPVRLIATLFLFNQFTTLRKWACEVFVNEVKVCTYA